MRFMDAKPLAPSVKLRLALEMFEGGVALMRQNLRRRHPTATEAEIDRLLVDWIRTRPGAEHGDSNGKPRPFSEPPA